MELVKVVAWAVLMAGVGVAYGVVENAKGLNVLSPSSVLKFVKANVATAAAAAAAIVWSLDVV